MPDSEKVNFKKKPKTASFRETARGQIIEKLKALNAMLSYKLDAP